MTDALGSSPTGSLVSCLDLSLMAAKSLGHVPAGRPGGIAATVDSLYISDPRRGLVWASEREGGVHYRAFRAGDAPSTLCSVTVM